MDYNRISRKLRGKIVEFSGGLSKGLPTVAGRFVREMLYGIQASQSIDKCPFYVLICTKYLSPFNSGTFSRELL